jgi:hypothetical protein
MKRDNDLIFAILSAIENDVTDIYSHLEQQGGYDEEQVTGHLVLLKPYINGFIIMNVPGSARPIIQMNSLLSLTNPGHDYLQSIKNFIASNSKTKNPIGFPSS